MCHCRGCKRLYIPCRVNTLIDAGIAFYGTQCKSDTQSCCRQSSIGMNGSEETSMVSASNNELPKRDDSRWRGISAAVNPYPNKRLRGFARNTLRDWSRLDAWRFELFVWILNPFVGFFCVFCWVYYVHFKWINIMEGEYSTQNSTSSGKYLMDWVGVSTWLNIVLLDALLVRL